MWKFQRRHQASPSNWRHEPHVIRGLERPRLRMRSAGRSPGKPSFISIRVYPCRTLNAIGRIVSTTRTSRSFTSLT